jgi:2-oxo-4-hydroxy-4-carboxy-5-ureidoimidazoline decarboxylase
LRFGDDWRSPLHFQRVSFFMAAVASTEKAMSHSILRHARALGTAVALACLPLAAGHAQANGKLSAHALDATIGGPAPGIVIELFDVSVDPPRKAAEVTTDAEGRADLIAGRPIAVGRYELRFAVADYFRKRGVPLGDPPFLDVVPIRLYLDDPAGDYHVPVVFTPWSYAKY